jgi:hypothetical protein
VRLSAPKFLGSAVALPSRKVIYQSLIASHLRRRFGLAGASPSQFILSLVPRPSSHSKSALRFLRHQLQVRTRSTNGFYCTINCGLKFVAWVTYFVLTEDCDAKPQMGLLEHPQGASLCHL